MHLKSFVSLCIVGQSALAAAQTTTTSISDQLLPPSSPSLLASCEPHGDHWHCPSGVSKPTTPPAQTGAAKPTSTNHEHDDEHEHEHEHEHGHDHESGTECTPHGDHWHCPSGVLKPTYPPTAAATTTPPSSTPTSGASGLIHGTFGTFGTSGNPLAVVFAATLMLSAGLL